MDEDDVCVCRGVDYVVGPIKTDISIKISSREVTMDTMVPACVTHHLRCYCKRIKTSSIRKPYLFLDFFRYSDEAGNFIHLISQGKHSDTE